MRPAGLAEVERAKADGRWEAAYDAPSTATRARRPAAPRSTRDRARGAFFEALDSQNRYAILLPPAGRQEARDARAPDREVRRDAEPRRDDLPARERGSGASSSRDATLVHRAPAPAVVTRAGVRQPRGQASHSFRRSSGPSGRSRSTAAAGERPEQDLARPSPSANRPPAGTEPARGRRLPQCAARSEASAPSGRRSPVGDGAVNTAERRRRSSRARPVFSARGGAATRRPAAPTRGDP